MGQRNRRYSRALAYSASRTQCWGLSLVVCRGKPAAPTSAVRMEKKLSRFNGASFSCGRRETAAVECVLWRSHRDAGKLSQAVVLIRAKNRQPGSFGYTSGHSCFFVFLSSTKIAFDVSLRSSNEVSPQRNCGLFLGGVLGARQRRSTLL